MLKKINDGVYKIEIPFDGIYTCCFLLTSGDDCIILDSGSCSEDAEQYIIPQIKALGLIPKYIVASHFHGDHDGGMGALRAAYPGAIFSSFVKNGNGAYCFSDGEILFCRYQMLNLKGHCEESLGVVDLHTKTLFSCDSLQLCGITKYGTGLDSVSQYKQTIQRVRGLDLDMIMTSHEYFPFGSTAKGEDVPKYLDRCIQAIEDIKDFALLHKDKSNDEIATLFGVEHPDYPTIYWKIVELAVKDI